LIPPTTPLTDVAGEPARLGTLVHRVLADVVRGEGVHDNLPELARTASVSIKDTSILVAIGVRAWRSLAVHFQEPRAEVPLESELLIGTADVAHHDGVTAAVGDWKSGWLEGEPAAQVTGYASCMREAWGMPSSGRIMAAPVFLRSDTIDVLQLNDAAIDAFEARVRKAKQQAGEVYGPGDACTYCPRVLECEPRAEWLRTAASSLVVAEPGTMQPADLAELYPTVKAIEGACLAYRAAMRSVVQVHGPQPVDGSKELRLIDSHESVIDPLKLRDVMTREPFNWGKEDLYSVFKASKAKLVDAIRADAPRGYKKSREDRLLLALEKAGAVTTTIKTQLRSVKK
jgi:hypothetical protein